MDFLEQPPHPKGPAVELKEFLEQYRQDQAHADLGAEEAHQEGQEQEQPNLNLAKVRNIANLPTEPQMNWKPGSLGKGAMLNGVPHTWNVGSDYTPNHLEYAKSQIGEGYKPGVLAQSLAPPYLVIREDGRIHPLETLGLSDPTLEHNDVSPFLQADARLQAPKPVQWNSPVGDLEGLGDIDFS